MNSEEEQIEAIKDWWRKNGTSIIITAIAAILLVTGFNWWKTNNAKQSQSGSHAYEQLMSSMNAQQEDPSAEKSAAVQDNAQALLDDHSKTGYASLAYLALAQVAVAEDDIEGAAEQLTALLDSKPDKQIANTARLRLARLQLELEQPKEALATLDSKFPEAWAARVAELKGDAYLQQENHKDALRSYEDALASLSSGDAIKERIQMKRDDLAPTS